MVFSKVSKSGEKTKLGKKLEDYGVHLRLLQERGKILGCEMQHERMASCFKEKQGKQLRSYPE